MEIDRASCRERDEVYIPEDAGQQPLVLTLKIRPVAELIHTDTNRG
jgi:hypothetical protein